MAGYDVALAEAQRLKAIMAKWGVPCSIELQRGRGDWWVRKYLRMEHHTVSRPSMGLTPALRICKEGRSDVPGPLCNGYGGYDLVYRIITMGLANHPGQGGPISIDGIYIPEDSARTPTWGTEWEGGIEDWTPEFLEFMGRSACALAEHQGRPLTSQLEHSTWTTRKIDRLYFTRARGITLTEYWAHNAGADDMPSEQWLLDNLGSKAWTKQLIFDSEARIKLHVTQEVNGLGPDDPVLVKSTGKYADGTPVDDPGYVAMQWAISAEGAEWIDSATRRDTLVAARQLYTNKGKPFLWNQDQIDAHLSDEQRHPRDP